MSDRERVQHASDEPDIEAHRKQKAAEEPEADDAEQDDAPDVEAHKKQK